MRLGDCDVREAASKRAARAREARPARGRTIVRWSGGMEELERLDGW